MAHSLLAHDSCPVNVGPRAILKIKLICAGLHVGPRAMTSRNFQHCELALHYGPVTCPVGESGAICDTLWFSAYRPAATKAMYSIFGLNIA